MSHQRCPWAQQASPSMVAYHDLEWGVPLHDDRKLFEFLLLESAQAGLSWQTILNRREGYRAAFASFDPQKMAKFSESDFEELLLNKEIIRNKLKIRSAINNAKLFLQIQKEFGSFDAYLWNFVKGKPIQNQGAPHCQGTSHLPEALALSKDLSKRGFTFVGPTIIYAFMQAVGLVNDHTSDCFRYSEIKKLK